ncbi:MAG: fibronectin type III domain-containing protein [Nocardioidaceae bacterium]|nr:fibronectin type III domain-containing protein [Nocardioidaceae bacterium]
MRTRLLVLLASVGVCVGTALVGVPFAQAAPDAGPAFTYQVLPMCSDDADGKECVVSATRDGAAMTAGVYPSTPGTHEWFYVDNGWRNGMFAFNLNAATVPAGPGPVTQSRSVDRDATWVITVNTGSYVPREVNSRTRNTGFVRGGNATTGYWFQISFNPVPIAWHWADGPTPCNMTACGDDSVPAEFVSDADKGFADGYVTDLGDSPSPRYVGARTGFVMASNAQYQGEPEYDATTNSLVISMANPHLRAPGVQATGFFEAFLPNSYLLNQLGVPYPSTLTGGSIVVQRLGTTTTTPFTLTHTSTGIWVRVAGIGFSRPRYRLTTKPSAPGMPRAVVARKITAHSARVRFVRPIANGGRRIDLYQARCHRVGKAWHYARRTVSPITVTRLPRGRVLCQVRAHNAKGYGRWSALDRS